MYNSVIDNNLQRETMWNPNIGEDFDYAKETILDVLKEQKVPLSKIRYLFHVILDEIEDKNPINY